MHDFGSVLTYTVTATGDVDATQAKMVFRTATARSVYELLTGTQQVKQALPVNEKFLTGRMTFECVSPGIAAHIPFLSSYVALRGRWTRGAARH